MRRFILLVALCISPVATAEPIPQWVRDDMTALEALLRQDPIKEAIAAIKKGDLRLLGIAGFAVHIPGVEHNIENCQPIYNRLVIVKGTSDFTWGDKHKALIEEARNYAGQYNAYIVNQKSFRLPTKCKAL